MFNHRRGLWGYTGTAPDGGLLSVQSTGMGGPSAAIVVEELVALGARRVVRIGTCGALDPALALGDVLVAAEVLSEDGASRALGAPARLLPDPGLTAALCAEAGAHPTTVVTTDLFYDERAGLHERWVAGGATAVEMEAAAVLRVAELRGARAACILAVSDILTGEGGRRRIDDEALQRIGIRLGEIGVAALATGHQAATR